MKSFTLRPDTFTLNFNLIFFRYRLVPGARTFEQLADGKEVHIDNAGFKESRFGNVARDAGESKA